MSSTRLPGKVLAPFRGEPIILHVIRAVRKVVGLHSIIVATGPDASDDPLVCYLEKLGVDVFRGPLGNVFERFRLCAEQFPCDWILRLSADSPLLNPDVLQKVVGQVGDHECDLVTTTFPRTFPRGNNAELIRVSTFLGLDPQRLTAEEIEHVTPFFYRHPNRFRIVNVESGEPSLANMSLAVDTLDDLRRLEQMSEAELRRFEYKNLTTRMKEPCVG